MPWADPNKPLPWSRLRWREWGWLYCANGLVSIFLCLGYMANFSGEMPATVARCLPLAVVSCAFCLNLIPAAASAGFYFFGRNRLAARTAAALFYASLQIFLAADVILFRLFHRHLDRATWELLSTQGTGETIVVGFWNGVAIAGLVLFLLGISCGLSYWLSPRLTRHKVIGMVLLAAACIVADKALFAFTELQQPATVYWLREYLPFFPFIPLPGNTQITATPDIGPPDNLATERLFDYPKNPIGFGKTLRRPNILFLLVDSARRDALRPDVMPNLWKWKEDALWLTNYYSTGNETREGVFGALYGLPANYLPYAARQRKGPVLLDVLTGLDYDIDVLSCAALSFPMCRQTAFLRVTNRITDDWTCAHEYRDMAMTDNFLQHLKSRHAAGPSTTNAFFAFLFYDAAHQPYSCPKEYQLHPADSATPYINYAHYAIVPAASREVIGFYENGLHYIDNQISRVIGELKAENIYDNTIIIVAGDHGEEFGEHGHFGHGSSFSPEQTRPLCLARFPGWATGASGRLSSAVDLAPSIMAWMGVTNAAADFSTGVALNESGAHSFVLSSDREHVALTKNDCMVVCGPQITQGFDRNCHLMNTNASECLTAGEWHEAARQRTYFLK